MCDRVNVMYAGRIVETGTVDELFEEPRMPYAWGLLDSLPADRRRPRRPPADDRGPAAAAHPAARRVPLRSALPSTPATSAATTEPELTARGATGHMARCLATEPEGWIG